uniref:GCV_T domain-containing protein n=1 Tax=Trichuris muris TaxID=70415 RepID=A0A5S6QC55_TRIMR
MTFWLRNRRLLRVIGPDGPSLLQGLLTNDVTKLNDPACPALCSFLLSARGRVLYDLLLYRQGQRTVDDILVECDGVLADRLCSFLRRHTLRKRVDLQLESTKQVYHSLPGASKPPCQRNDIFVADPRLSSMGARWLSDRAPPAGNDPVDNRRLLEAYTNLRYSLALAEGGAEMPPDSSLPHEVGADILGAVSFTKGCYLGQEMIARVQHGGIVRKRLMALQFDPADLPLMRLVQYNSAIFGSSSQNSKAPPVVVGRFKAASTQYAIATLNVAEAIRLGTVLLTVKEEEQDDSSRKIHCKVIRPQWWPTSVG